MSATTMVYFDTLHYVKTLKASGFSSDQAEALAEANQEALSECLTTSFATKTDIADVKSDIKVLTSRVNRLDWMMGLLLIGMASLVVKAFFV
jgi:hypothetical protein